MPPLGPTRWIGPDLVAVGTAHSRLGRLEQAEALTRRAVAHNRRMLSAHVGGQG